MADEPDLSEEYYHEDVDDGWASPSSSSDNFKVQWSTTMHHSSFGGRRGVAFDLRLGDRYHTYMHVWLQRVHASLRLQRLQSGRKSQFEQAGWVNGCTGSPPGWPQRSLVSLAVGRYPHQAALASRAAGLRLQTVPVHNACRGRATRHLERKPACLDRPQRFHSHRWGRVQHLQVRTQAMQPAGPSGLALGGHAAGSAAGGMAVHLPGRVRRARGRDAAGPARPCTSGSSILAATGRCTHASSPT